MSCGTELWGPKPVIPDQRFCRLCNLGLPNKQRFSLQRHKTPEFGEAEFSDCLPVSALECFSANETGGLGLWLGAFGRSRLYRCQSTPGPPMPCFVAQSFAFASGNSCFTNSRVQKLQKALLFAIVCRFFVAQSFAFAVFATLVCLINSVFPCKDTKAQEFGIRRILGLYAGFLFYQRRVPKLQKAALFAIVFAIVCRFSPWNVFPPMKSAVWGFGLGLLGGQGFIGAKASLDPLCRALWHRASFWHRNILF